MYFNWQIIIYFNDSFECQIILMNVNHNLYGLSMNYFRLNEIESQYTINSGSSQAL